MGKGEREMILETGAHACSVWLREQNWDREGQGSKTIQLNLRMNFLSFKAGLEAVSSLILIIQFDQRELPGSRRENSSTDMAWRGL